MSYKASASVVVNLSELQLKILEIQNLLLTEWERVVLRLGSSFSGEGYTQTHDVLKSA